MSHEVATMVSLPHDVHLIVQMFLYFSATVVGLVVCLPTALVQVGGHTVSDTLRPVSNSATPFLLSLILNYFFEVDMPMCVDMVGERCSMGNP